MDHLALRWETDSRYYAVYLHSDLWGDKVLTKVWGGKGSHIGGQQHSPVTAEQIEQALQEIAERRRKHKYQPADLITREYLQRIAGTVPARKSNAGTD